MQVLRSGYPAVSADGTAGGNGIYDEAGLLERQSELEALSSLSAAALSGSGGTGLIEAPAGAGKSALLSAAAARAAACGLQVLRARGSELEQEFPFGIVRQLFEPALGSLSPSRRDEALAGAAAVAVDAHDVDRESAPTSFAVLHGLHQLTTRLADQRPLLLVVDDIHWADGSSLRALTYLAGRIAESPVALVVALRPGEPGAPDGILDALAAQPGTIRVAPEPLSASAVARLVRDRLPGADAVVCAAAGEATGGNPLYVQELLRSLPADGRAPPEDAAAWIRQAAVPSLGDRVERRIARVAHEAPAVARAMAVVGDGGSLSLAAHAAGVPLVDAGQIARQLRRIEVLMDEDPFAFVHPLVRRSVYDAMPSPERDSAHAMVADLLEAEDGSPQAVAAHRGAVTPHGSMRTATTLLHAAQEATARSAPDEAVRWYRRALIEDAAEPAREQILADLGLAEVAVFNPEAIPHLQEAFDNSSDVGLRARVAVSLAPALFVSGRWAEAVDVIDASQAEMGDGEPVASAQLAAVGLIITGYAPALSDRLPQDPERLDALSEGGSLAAAALAAVRAAMASHHGETAERVLALADQALEGDRLLNAPDAPAWATSHLLIALAQIDDYERGLEVSGRMMTAAERTGSVHSLHTAASHSAWIRARRGELAEAVGRIRPWLDLSAAADAPTFLASQLFYLQEALLDRGGLEDLAETVETLDLDAAGLAGTCMGAMIRTVRGRLRLTRRADRESGLEDLRSALHTFAALGLGPTTVPSRSLVALALPAEDRVEALALVDAELELARASGLARPEGIALRAAGMLQDGPKGIGLLRRSEELFEAAGARLERARTLLALGAALRRGGRRTDARVELSEAIELSRLCGADRLEARVAEELRVAGGRPRRPTGSGKAALTAAERRVARLAAEGASNGAIAQDLYVSTKTVETHLSSAYRKLGLTGQGSRAHLAGALGGD